MSNATADVNGDGHLDLLHTNYISDNVSVLLGDGLGGFVAAAPVPVTNGPRQIVVGDLDGDGDIDFLATNYSGNNVTVGLNNGAGTFATSSVAVGSVPRGISIGDLDGDGDLDFVSANYNSNTLSVMLNNGNGTFAAAAGSPLATSATRPVQTIMSDFDGDGDLDLATSLLTGNVVELRLNNGNGTFAAATTVATGAGPRGLTAGDVDGDGDQDLVVGNFLANSVSVLLNDGSGGFTAGTPAAVGNNPYDVKLGDLDGDGDLDMVVSNSGASSISTLLNDGTGIFTPASGSPSTVGVSPGGVSLGDFDEDGDLDVATSNFGSNTTSILINTSANYSVSSAVSDVEGLPGAPGVLTFTISRSATSEAEDVTYTLGGTATTGVDYTAPSGMVSFAAGQSSINVQITLAADGMIEGNETVVMTLATTSGEGVISTTAGSGTATIIDDDVFINSPPSGTSKIIEMDEDTAHTFAAADFGFSDGDGNTLKAVIITTLPGNGTLELDGVVVTAGQSIAAGDLDELVWTPEHNAFGDALATIDFQVVDNGGGSDTDTTPNTLTFDVADTPDQIGGGGDNNRLIGTAGADKLFGRKGNDDLLGLGGDDLLRSRRGNDRMWGGDGADTFIFTTNSGRDRIMDFETGIDKIDVSHWKAIDDFDDLKAHAENKDGGVWITAGKDTLIIEDFDKKDLDPGDFLF